MVFFGEKIWDEFYSKLSILLDYLSSFPRKTIVFYQHSQSMDWISQNENCAPWAITVVPHLKEELLSASDNSWVQLLAYSSPLP